MAILQLRRVALRSSLGAGMDHLRAHGPLRGVERPRRVVRFARLIHRRGRALGPAFGPRRLRRQSQPDLSPRRVMQLTKVDSWLLLDLDGRTRRPALRKGTMEADYYS